jgi:protein-L-isoaspartate O-methyltransferase
MAAELADKVVGVERDTQVREFAGANFEGTRRRHRLPRLLTLETLRIQNGG